MDVELALWPRIQGLLPEFAPSPLGGPKRAVDDLQALNGILYVLRTGIAWEKLPKSLGYGTGMTCWRRLKMWRDAGAWMRVQDVLQRELEHPEIYDFSRITEPLRGGRPRSGRLLPESPKTLGLSDENKEIADAYVPDPLKK